jgi:hypothetical protein
MRSPTKAPFRRNQQPPQSAYFNPRIGRLGSSIDEQEKLKLLAAASFLATQLVSKLVYLPKRAIGPIRGNIILTK